MILTGIDPDFNGGLATIDPEDHTVKLVTRMPVFEPPVKGKRRIDAPGLYEALLQARRVGSQYVILESPLVMPQKSKKGPAMMGNVNTVHQTYGAIRAVAELLFSRSRVIPAWPSVWKKDMGLSSDKDLSLPLARDLYPSHTSLLSKKKNTGLAEAILMAEWGHRKCT